jgi:5-methylcytosine-specific restriction endonuclease McrA
MTRVASDDAPGGPGGEDHRGGWGEDSAHVLDGVEGFGEDLVPEPVVAGKPPNLSAPSVLVLNASFEPLHVCSIKRAVTLLMDEAAERVEDTAAFLRSPSTNFPVPSVIRLRRYVRRPPRYHVAFNRRNVFRRDGHTCQYCGRGSGDLTLDHVMPKSRGGRSTWENIVTACRECNSRKRDRTPEEARMHLLRRPFAPRFVFTTAYGQPPRLDPAWEKYLG